MGEEPDITVAVGTNKHVDVLPPDLFGERTTTDLLRKKIEPQYSSYTRCTAESITTKLR
jgi:hypothetical protein